MRYGGCGLHRLSPYLTIALVGSLSVFTALSWASEDQPRPDSIPGSGTPSEPTPVAPPTATPGEPVVTDVESSGPTHADPPLLQPMPPPEAAPAEGEGESEPPADPSPLQPVTPSEAAPAEGEVGSEPPADPPPLQPVSPPGPAAADLVPPVPEPAITPQTLEGGPIDGSLQLRQVKTLRPIASLGRATSSRTRTQEARRRAAAWASRARGEEALQEFEAACRDRPQSETCESFLAPETCGPGNVFNQNPGQPGSCRYLLGIHPCWANPRSDGCRLFLQNPCFQRPDGPSCLGFVGRASPPGCSFATPNVSLECQVLLVALLDMCEVGSENCDLPFGGSQEVLAFARVSGEEEARRPREGDPTSPALAGLELASVEPGVPARASANATEEPLAGTGLGLGRQAVGGVLLVLGGCGLCLAVSGLRRDAGGRA